MLLWMPRQMIQRTGPRERIRGDSTEIPFAQMGRCFLFCISSASVPLPFCFCSITSYLMLLWMPWGQLHREGFEKILQESHSHKFVDICWTISEVRYIQIYAYNCYSGFQAVSVDTISQQFLLLCPMNVIFGLCSFFCLGCQWGCRTWQSRGRLQGNFCFLWFVFVFLSWLPMRMPHKTLQRTTLREFLFSLLCVLFSILVANQDAAHDYPEDNSEGMDSRRVSRNPICTNG